MDIYKQAKTMMDAVAKSLGSATSLDSVATKKIHRVVYWAISFTTREGNNVQITMKITPPTN
jgi:hypothetical protein